MRHPAAIIVVLVAVASWGCSERATSPASPAAATAPATANAANAVVTYNPATFRADIERLIDGKQYRQAVGLVKAADVERQLAADGEHGGYMAVALDMILLPGVYPQIEYDRQRDWEVPGTSDAIEDTEWQNVASDFARRYNVRRRG